ncbi:MAG: hypothetical protein HY079_05315 [Elusimicrobia bacterium]|nr:hypothetical protein [Elusimicrobiota bacterium]
MSALEACPSCQAPHSPGEAFCWMCHSRLWSGEAPAAAPKTAAAPPPPAPAPSPAAAPSARSSASFLDRWTQPVLVVSFILIMAGLMLDRQTGGAVLLLGLVPAVLVTALSGLRPAKRKPETAWEWVVFVAEKLASVVAIMLLAAFAISAALLMACFVILKALGMH